MRRGPPNMVATVRRFAFHVTRERHVAPTPSAEGLPRETVAPTATTILMHAYPAPGKVVAQYPEGLEGSRVLVGFTPADLLAGNEATGQRPDSILVFGGRFEVRKIGDWAGGRDGDLTWRQCELVEVFRP